MHSCPDVIIRSDDRLLSLYRRSPFDGFCNESYVFLETKPGTSEEVLKHLRTVSEVKGVKQIDSVYGRFDAIVIVEAADLSELAISFTE